MERFKFFETVIEPSVERLGLFGLSHDVNFDGRNFVVFHKVSKNVFTEFDGRLSRYLAAVKGKGLPNATIQTTIRDVSSGQTWAPYAPRHAPSVPHALAIAGRLALGSAGAAGVRVGAWTHDGMDPAQPMDLTSETLDMLERGLEICGEIGSIEFLEISGDFERILVRPVGSGLDMISIDIGRGMLSIPNVSEMGGAAWQGPVFGFETAAQQAPAIMVFLGRARHAVATAKEAAIHAFRESAEQRIMNFNDALAGRSLTGYRLESATSLVSRLQAGLGDTLLGLSEAAQMTALDWASQVRELPGSDRTIERRKPRSTDPIRPRLVDQV